MTLEWLEAENLQALEGLKTFCELQCETPQETLLYQLSNLMVFFPFSPYANDA